MASLGKPVRLSSQYTPASEPRIDDDDDPKLIMSRRNGTFTRSRCNNVAATIAANLLAEFPYSCERGKRKTTNCPECPKYHWISSYLFLTWRRVSIG
jgi:hypothetical protein